MWLAALLFSAGMMAAEDGPTAMESVAPVTDSPELVAVTHYAGIEWPFGEHRRRKGRCGLALSLRDRQPAAASDRTVRTGRSPRTEHLSVMPMDAELSAWCKW
jgi:hypothetical protein